MKNLDKMNDDLSKLREKYNLEVMIVLYFSSNSNELGGMGYGKDQIADLSNKFYHESYNKFRELVLKKKGVKND